MFLPPAKKVPRKLLSKIRHVSYLTPANEVWDKVIFSEACVKNSVHRGGAWSGRGAWSWGCLVWGLPGPGGCMLRGVSRPTAKGKLRGIWSRPTAKGEIEGDLVQAQSQGGISGGSGWGVCGDPPPMTATAAGGTHPTGMHSCATFFRTSMARHHLLQPGMHC